MNAVSPMKHKIKTAHLARRAYLYVRQSTLRQVLENTESSQRQYALRERAVALGWPADNIEVIDEDQGKSGADSDGRVGFQRLVAEVGVGHAGIVMGLEVSRLARNNADWHRLLEICALTDTLILDEDGVYDPAHFNDRLLLGLKARCPRRNCTFYVLGCGAGSSIRRDAARSRSGFRPALLMTRQDGSSWSLTCRFRRASFFSFECLPVSVRPTALSGTGRTTN